MGGDNAPRSEVGGAVAAVREFPVEIVLVGNARRIETQLRSLDAERQEGIHVHHASEIVTMEDAPGVAFRPKAGFLFARRV